jgi:probable HAF family extracellular repeat protein
MQELGALPVFDSSEATAVSADGTVVVGFAYNANREYRAVRWTQATGMQDLNALYASLLTPGSRLEQANAISPDGRYIVGTGWNAGARRLEGFLLDTIPEPASMLALCAALTGLLLQRYGRRSKRRFP